MIVLFIHKIYEHKRPMGLKRSPGHQSVTTPRQDHVLITHIKFQQNQPMGPVEFGFKFKLQIHGHGGHLGFWIDSKKYQHLVGIT